MYTASAIGQITKIAAEVAKDSVIEVIQKDSPCKCNKHTSCCTACTYHQSSNHIDLCHSSSYDKDADIRHTIKQSLGVTGSGLAKHPGVAGNIMLKNKLRKELGGKPTTTLSCSGLSVNQFWDRTKKAIGHWYKCSRTSRNSLKNLWSSDSKSTKENKWRLVKRMKLKLLEIQFSKTGEEKKKTKQKVKHIFDTLNGRKKVTEKNEMIPYICDMHISDPGTFDSKDAAE